MLYNGDKEKEVIYMSTFTEKFNRQLKEHPVTTIILLLNTLMLLVTLALGGFDSPNLIRLGGLVPELITENGDYHRLILSMFLHGGILHFLFNSYFLYIIGGFVEKLLGKSKFIIIYFLSGLGGSLLVWWLGDSNTVTIGASGALFGIMGALLILTYIKTSWFTAYTIKSVRRLVIINLIFTFLVPNISKFGHLGGFATGIALVYLMIPKSPHDKNGFNFQRHQQQNSYSQSDVIDQEDIDDEDIYIS
jgi:rhomboid protease GluP